MANNKLIKTDIAKLTRSLDTPGLFTCAYEYEVKSAVGELTYTGPKISRGDWNQVIAFFRWVNESSHSEAQVRMFFDPDANRVFFHAFPQARNTGMTTREVDTEESRAQRANLPNSSNLVNVGTVHSHCTVSAFQSGTDEENEKGQDGLHITLGHVNLPVLSIHARFYRKRDLFDPDLSKFWDIGDELLSLPESLISILPADAEDKLARAQMCVAPPVDQTFPEQWRLNIVEPPRAVPPWFVERPIQHYWKDGEFRWCGSDRYQRQGDDWVFVPMGKETAYQPSFGATHEPTTQGVDPTGKVDKNGTGKRRKQKGKDTQPLGVRIEDALNEIVSTAAVYQFEDKDVEEALEAAAMDEMYKTIVQVCRDYEVNPGDLWDHYKVWEFEQAKKGLASFDSGPTSMYGDEGYGFMHGGC